MVSIVGLAVLVVGGVVAALALLGWVFKRRYGGYKVIEEPTEIVVDVEPPEPIEAEYAPSPPDEVSDSLDTVDEDEVIEEELEAVVEVKPSNGDRKTRKSKSSRKRRKGRSLPRRIERKIISMYRKGMSPKEIADALGVSTSTVYRKLRGVLATKKAKAR